MEISMNQLKAMLVNPYYAINVSEVTATPHETMISKDEWIKAFTVSVMQDDNGKKLEAPEDIEVRLREALTRVLDNLESNEVPLGYKES